MIDILLNKATYHIIDLTNGSRSGSKCKLKEPTDKIFTRRESIEEKALVANETLFGGVCSAIGEGVSDGPVSSWYKVQMALEHCHASKRTSKNRPILPETEGTATSIEYILEHNILNILLANRSGTEHL